MLDLEHQRKLISLRQKIPSGTTGWIVTALSPQESLVATNAKLQPMRDLIIAVEGETQISNDMEKFNIINDAAFLTKGEIIHYIHVTINL